MFKEAYLRVLTPDTTNGRDPVILPNGKIKYTESHMHILAKPMMEKKNAKRPNHLKYIIDLIEVDQPEPPKPVTASDLLEQLKKLSPEQRQALLSEVSPETTNGNGEPNGAKETKVKPKNQVTV